MTSLLTSTALQDVSTSFHSVLIFSPRNLNFRTIDPIEMDDFSLQILNKLSLSHVSLTDFESQHVILP